MAKPLTLTIRGSGGTGGVTVHNDLTSIQGGSSTERYHLELAQHTVATQAATTALNGYLTSTDWNTFNGKQTALGFTPEDVGNKDTSTSLGVSDTKYPSQNAVKSYVDTGLSAKEDVLNKENTTIDTSTTKYPTVNLLKTGLGTKQDILIYKLIEDDYELTLQNNIIVVQNTTSDIILELPSVGYAYKRIFNIVNETDYKVTLFTRYDDKFYNSTSSLELTTKGESIEITAFKGWHILSKFVP